MITDNFNPTEWITTKEAAELTGITFCVWLTYHWEFYSGKDLLNKMLYGAREA